MNIYKIELDEKTNYYGLTKFTLAKTKWAHRHCFNNIFCNCSLYQYMRKTNITEFNLELLQEKIHPSVARNRLNVIREAHDSTLKECRAEMILDKETWIKNNSMACTCNELQKEDIEEGKPFIMKFD
tara:strand:+ start:4423 stop:4803 length:381 start_codon:yes stop_codon:yes gene_type:complete